MPRPRDDVEFEVLADEPWFVVRHNDVFPEEFRAFLRLPGDANRVFVEHHADLFEVRFWQKMQEHLHAGELIDIFPYSQARRIFPKARRGLAAPGRNARPEASVSRQTRI